MILASFILFSMLMSSAIGLNEDMIETGYLQDPTSVGKLPTEFEEDIADMDHGYINEDTMEEYQDEFDERSMEDVLLLDMSILDSEMKSQLRDYCNTKEGKDDVVCKLSF